MNDQTSSSPISPEKLETCVYRHLQCYLDDLQGQPPANMYGMLLHVVERPLLRLVLERTQGNQSKAAQWLGINRNTLRKLLMQHKLLECRPAAPETRAPATRRKPQQSQA